MSDCNDATCKDPSNKKSVKVGENDAPSADRGSAMVKPEKTELYEPKTPLWFTLLGVGLLLSGIVAAVAVNVHERAVQGEQAAKVEPIPEQEPLEPTEGVPGELQKNVDNE